LEDLVYLAFALILVLAIAVHLRRHSRREAQAIEAARRAGLKTGDGPRAQHPHIDVDWCIGCGACVSVCPEGDVLQVIGGKAALVNGAKCIGHGLCADACPIGAIEIVMASPSMTADLPALSPECETTVANLFIAGELGGMALIRNAVNQGRDCADRIAERIAGLRARPEAGDPAIDVVIVGAGPAGLSAALRAHERGLSYLLFEAEEFGGTVANYPRQKLVMTSPVELPTFGMFKKLEISKEELLTMWKTAATKVGLRIRTREPVVEVTRDRSGRFMVKTGIGEVRAQAVVLAIGRRGSPRKLGVPGEELSHVMYSLLDAEAYTGRRILVVGGGDSAVEAAMGLAHQDGNRVLISYRKSAFSRLKDRNEKRLADVLRQGRLTVLFDSQPVEIRKEAVLIQVGAERREIPADYVWIFAGGTPPKEFLEKMGIAFGRQDLSAAARAASHDAHAMA
jgi:thioredoxin reductase (NADPH)